MNVLMLGKIWPEARASAASTRVLDLAEALKGHGARLTFSTDARPNAAMAALAATGVRCVRHAPNDAEFDRFLGELRPDVVLFDTFTTEEKFSWRVKAALPDCVRVLDTVDLHFLRQTRERLVDAGRPLPGDVRTLLEEAGDLALREVASIYRSDLTLVTSDFELTLLTEHCGVPATILQLCRLTYPPFETAPGFAARRGYALIGSYRHAANIDAIGWLKSEIWPRIRARKPDAEVSIFGSHAKPEHLALTAPDEGFRVLGAADDQFAALSACRVNLAPLRFGAGVKGKIADGWWCGTPAVGTSMGAEGMTGGMPFGGIIADDPESFAREAVRLYEDEPLWNAAAASGLKIMASLFSRQATTLAFLDRLAGARATPFTSRMVWQQGLRATEYFSRWIELKASASTSSPSPRPPPR